MTGVRGEAAAKPAGSARSREIAALDLARLLAAQAVVFYHLVFLSWAEGDGTRGIRAVVGSPVAFPQATGWASLGWVGVQVFFVISGFVILMSARNRSAWEFLAARVTRIAPALWFFSLLSALVLLGCGVLAPGEAAPRLLRSLVLFPVGPWIDGAVWTLVAEAVFYAGVFVLIRTGLIDRMLGVTAVLTACNLAFWAAVLAGEAGLLGGAGGALADAAASYKLRVTLVTTNCYFVVGASLYGLFLRRDVAGNAAVFAINYAAGLVATYYAARSSIGVSQFGQSAFAAPALWGVVTLVMAACVLGRAGSGPRMARLATMAGLLTYPLYLINQITGGLLLGLAYRAGVPPVVAVVLTAALCTLLAGAFALGLEQRLQQRLAKALRRPSRPAPALGEA